MSDSSNPGFTSRLTFGDDAAPANKALGDNKTTPPAQGTEVGNDAVDTPGTGTTAGVGGSSGGSTTATPYAVRRLEFDFALGKGSFGSTGSTKLSVATGSGIVGTRGEVTIEHAQVPAPGPTAVMNVYGMTLSEMNDLSKAGLIWDTRQNEVSVRAGDDLAGMVTVFQGIIIEAYPNIDQPNAPFFVRANPGPVTQLKPVKPLGYPQSTDVKVALQTMAKQAGLTLEDNGINVQLGPTYWPGTTWDQITATIRAANLYGTVDSVNGVLAVWPKTASRNGEIITIEPGTGMIGYPKFQGNRVTVRTLFGPQVSAIVGGAGKKIRIKSQLKAANGEFVIETVTLALTAQVPKGPWEAVITCYPEPAGQSGG